MCCVQMVRVLRSSHVKHPSNRSYDKIGHQTYEILKRVGMVIKSEFRCFDHIFRM